MSIETAHSSRLAYSISEVSRLVGLSRDSIYSEIGLGHLKVTKIGGRTLVPSANLDAWLHPQSDAAPGTPQKRGRGRPRKGTTPIDSASA